MRSRTNFVAIAATALVIGVVGCGNSESTTAAAESTSSTPNNAVATLNTATFTIRDGAKSSGPDLVEARRGDTVTFGITADKPEQLHIHGYDKHVELQPGANQVQFVADIPGTFEVELHSTDSLVTRVRVVE